MATIAELLASSLSELKQVQQSDDFTIIRSSDLSRVHIKRLVDSNFLKPIIKGWYVVTDPNAMPGDSTAWYASFWNFIARYANERYDKEWCLSAEQSLAIYSGLTTIPQQVLIRTPKGKDYTIPLIFSTSIFNLKADLPTKISTANPYKLNLYTLEEAIILATPAMYLNDAITMRTALAMVNDSSGILKILVDTGRTTRAGRLIGAFRNIGRDDIADDIAETMKSIGYKVYEEDPFESKIEIHTSKSPYTARLRLMWQNMRGDVMDNFFMPKRDFSAQEFLEKMESRYKSDAYHSLSIEGYRVTDSLINKVRIGIWDPSGEDKESRNALAARGYWQAFQKVKQSVEDILNGNDSTEIVKRDLSIWHSEMFMPCVTAGIIKASDIVGYRSHQVYIRNSIHTPLNPDSLLDAMTSLFDLLQEEPEACVRAILGHFIFTFIHPFMDGNGRIGRFLMNVMFASGTYDWLIIPVERRDEYMLALEKASVDGDIIPFVSFLSGLATENPLNL